MYLRGKEKKRKGGKAILKAKFESRQYTRDVARRVARRASEDHHTLTGR